MAIILSPWPATTAAVAREAARACLDSAIQDDLSGDRLDALGEAASAMVERYAPDAPQSARNEAVIRLAAYLVARMPRSLQSVQASGIRVNYGAPQKQGDTLALSGARSLLTPWRTRRALPIEESA